MSAMSVWRDVVKASLVFMLLVYSMVLCPAHTLVLFVHPVNEVTVTCDTSQHNQHNKFLSVVESLSNKSTVISVLDLVNDVVTDITTFPRGTLVSETRGKQSGDSWLQVSLTNVWSEPWENLSYYCSISYGSDPVQQWMSHAISFRPFCLAGPTPVQQPGIQATFSRGVFLECLMNGGKTVSDVSIQRTDDNDIVCSSSSRSSLCSFSSFPANGHWLKYTVFNASNSDEGTYRCVTSPSRDSREVQTIVPGCDSIPTYHDSSTLMWQIFFGIALVALIVIGVYGCFFCVHYKDKFTEGYFWFLNPPHDGPDNNAAKPIELLQYNQQEDRRQEENAENEASDGK